MLVKMSGLIRIHAVSRPDGIPEIFFEKVNFKENCGRLKVKLHSMHKAKLFIDFMVTALSSF